MAKGGFRGGYGGMNQANMMKQAQKMQQDFLRMQKELEEKEFTAKSGGGMVSAWSAAARGLRLRSGPGWSIPTTSKMSNLVLASRQRGHCVNAGLTDASARSPAAWLGF